MTDETAHVAKLREAYRQWSDTKGKSAEHWVGLFADEGVSMRSLAGGATGMEFTRERSSKDDIRKYFEGLAVDWTMIYYTTEQFIAQGDWVVMVGRCKFEHKRTGKVVETPKCDVFRFRQGKVVSFMEFYDTARALEATR
jgi:ketosteroid isomerase-like protein